MKKFRKILASTLAVAMLIGIAPGTAITGHAEESQDTTQETSEAESFMPASDIDSLVELSSDYVVVGSNLLKSGDEQFVYVMLDKDVDEFLLAADEDEAGVEEDLYENASEGDATENDAKQDITEIVYPEVTFEVVNSDTGEQLLVPGYFETGSELVAKFDVEEAGSYTVTAVTFDSDILPGISFCDSESLTFGVDKDTVVEADAWFFDEENAKLYDENTVADTENIDIYSVNNSETDSSDISISGDMILSTPSGMENLGKNASGKYVIALNAECDDYDKGDFIDYNGSRIYENTINGKIQQYIYEYLLEYDCSVVKCPRYSAHDYSDEGTAIQKRVDYAESQNADVIVSIGMGDPKNFTNPIGAYIIVQNKNYKAELNTIGTRLGNKILERIKALKLLQDEKESGVFIANDGGKTYPDGSMREYYYILSRSKLKGIPTIMIHHAYLSTKSEYEKFLSSDAKLKNLAKADAEGIIAEYGLKKKQTTPTNTNTNTNTDKTPSTNQGSNSTAVDSTPDANAINTYNGTDYSDLYDYRFYIAKYADLKRAFGSGSKEDREKAIRHFVVYGMKEGRQASSKFSLDSYKNAYVDLRNAFSEDWPKYYMHYIKYGKREGRVAVGVTTRRGNVTKYNGVDYSAVFNADYYFQKNADIVRAFGTNNDIAALKHFINYGMKEGRNSIASFSLTSYAYAYVDLRRAFGNDYAKYYLHYMNYGKKEKRVTTGVTAMRGYMTVLNGVNYSPLYDCNYYITKYPDIKKAFGFCDDKILQHFVNYGMKECRRPSANFNVYSYANRYRDLQKAFGGNMPNYYIHYIKYGYKEGRNATGNDTKYMPNYIPNSEDAMWRYLSEEGFTDYAIAGALGCLQAESGLKADIIEAEFVSGFPERSVIIADLNAYCRDYLFPYYADVRKLPISKAGYTYYGDGLYYPGIGLCQWTGTRAYRLLHFNPNTKKVEASYYNNDWNNAAVQLDYLLNVEISKTFWNSYKTISPQDGESDTECVNRAVDTFFSTVEYPNNHQARFLNPRQTYANNIFKRGHGVYTR